MNKKLELTQNVTDIQATRPRGASRDYFIGLALSGGGSRAANFGSAVLWELDRLGILQHVQYISTVSGGSLAGAYYVTFRDDPLKWNKQNLQQVMSQSFEFWSLWYGLNPIHWLQYLGTSYNRSHLLEEVFYRRVFEQRTFGDLRVGEPSLLLNATDYSTAERFVFSNYSFDNMRSDLGALPISVGVTASAAFPGIFPNVTLRSFNEKGGQRWADHFNHGAKSIFNQYFHLFDGGVSDNLGLDTLTDTYIGGRPFSRGCLIILVDAYVPYEDSRASTKLNPRHFWDVLIDTNALNATSILMQSKRHEQLKAIGFHDGHEYQTQYKWTEENSMLAQLEDVWRKTKDPKDLEAYKKAYNENIAGRTKTIKRGLLPNEVEIPRGFLEEAPLTRIPIYATPEVESWNCKVWHVALNDLGFNASYPNLYTKDYEARHGANLNKSFELFKEELGHIATRFKISDSEVRALYVAAELLVNETKSKNTICKWLTDITGQRCTVP
jgi:predicted acylesterase/phospholipase RssA